MNKLTGKTWWAKRWLQALAASGLENRLQRGRTYASRGHVLEYQLKKGQITAKVAGASYRPYKITITIQQLSSAEWDKAEEVIARQALFSAQLLAGDIPDKIEEELSLVGVQLFPSGRELTMSCSCLDEAVPCKHIVAVFYVVGQLLSEDPFLLFTLRGKAQDELMDAVMQQRAENLQSESGKMCEAENALQNTNSEFWQIGGDINKIAYTSETVVPALEILGLPPAWSKGENIMDPLNAMYRHVAETIRARRREKWEQG